ncbi:MAG: electron transfer flavoprotein subunit alpha/FixB family protein, partial [Ignavibacteria bacterium]|nr:electron transfer flavoprotein subunit alpha/FixB family protein [Ignavibacteria bacterium]
KEEVKNYKKYIIDCLPGEKHNETLKLLSRRALDRGQDLQTARVLFVAGLGIGSKRNLQTMIDLANSLGIGWGVSRPLVDIGWAEQSRQIGQTGQIVSPDLLISFGVSGAIQHLAGISKSKAIIAINHDETAPIFNSASLGVVADCSEVLKSWFRNKNIMKK